MGQGLMMNVSIRQAFGLQDLATVVVPSLRRALPGPADPDDGIHVDVRVRSYDDVVELVPTQPAPWQERGRLPVGSLLDCYL